MKPLLLKPHRLDRPQRLWHGPGSCSIDWYPPYIVFEFYQELSVDDLVEQVKTFAEGVVFKKRKERMYSGFRFDGKDIPDLHFIEDDYGTYGVQLLKNQNTGYFLDMDEGRRFLATHSKGLRVLNLFSYTCTLSIAALAGGATHVTNVDMKKSFLQWGRENHERNKIDRMRVSFLPYDLFNSWTKIIGHGPYGLIIIDPPSDQGESFKLDRDYPKILKRIDDLTMKGSFVLMACNSPYVNTGIMNKWLEPYHSMLQVKEEKFSSYPIDDPQKGLKMLLLEKMI